MSLVLATNSLLNNTASASIMGDAYQLVSLGHDGVGTTGTGNAQLTSPKAISPDGLRVIFSSKAANMVINDTNGAEDIFIRDLRLGITKRVNITSTGDPTELGSATIYSASSSTGRYVAYRSNSVVLAAPDSANVYRSYVHDTNQGTNQQITFPSTTVINESRIVALSNDGRYLTALIKKSGMVTKLYLHDRLNATWQRIAQPLPNSAEQNGIDIYQSSSCDGSVGLFTSAASNLTEGDANNRTDLFLYDIRNGSYNIQNLTATLNAEVYNAQHSERIKISCNGEYIAFGTAATGLPSGVDLSNQAPGTINCYVFDRIHETYDVVNQYPDSTVFNGGCATNPSDNGVILAGKSGEFPAQRSLFVRNTRTKTTTPLFGPLNPTTQMNGLSQVNPYLITPDADHILINSSRTDLTSHTVSGYYADVYVTTLKH